MSTQDRTSVPEAGSGAILVTGAHGFIGVRLSRALADLGIKSIGVVRRQNKRKLSDSVRVGDLVSSKVLEQIHEPVTSIVHLAGRIDGTTGEHFRENVEATYAVARWAKSRGIQKVIYASTLGVHAPTMHGKILNERSEVTPPSTYGMTKFLGEQVLAASGLPHVALRFSFLYGPGDSSGFMARLHTALEQGTPLVARSEARDFLHVDDAVQAILKTIQYTGTEDTFCLGSGRLTDIPNLVQAAEARVGRKADIRWAHPRINGRVDWSLAKAELGWSPATSGLSSMFYGKIFQMT